MGNRAVLEPPELRSTRNPTTQLTSYPDGLATVFPYVMDVPVPLACIISVELTVRGGGHTVTSEPWNGERRVYFSEFSRPFVEAELSQWTASRKKRQHAE